MSGPGGARISVVLAVYNGSRYLDEQLTSVREQERPPDEIVVVDDGSDDGSLDIVREVLGDGPTDVVISTNASRLGPAANFGEGIRRATGDTIVLCDQDDRWRSDKLARLESVLQRTNALAVFSDGRLIDGAGVPLGRRLWEDANFTGRHLRRWEREDQLGVLLRTNVVTGASLAFRASLRRLVLPIPPTAWHDHWIALLAASTGSIVAVPDLLIDYRLHGLNAMGLESRSMRDRLGRWLSAPDLARTSLRLRDVHQRLQEHDADDDVLLRMEEMIQHFECRSGLPAARPVRVLPVMREAASGRYHRLASGAGSIVVDLIRKPAQRRDTQPASSGRES